MRNIRKTKRAKMQTKRPITRNERGPSRAKAFPTSSGNTISPVAELTIRILVMEPVTSM